MTHDELMGKIDETSGWINSTPLSSKFQTRLLNQYNALRVVVELHKPFHPEFGGGIDYCWADDRPYPCPTIQAIEEELN